MAKLLYCFKMSVMSKIDRFVLITVLVYVPWWLSAPIAAAAPLNDLKLINTLIEFKAIGKPNL